MSQDERRALRGKPDRTLLKVLALLAGIWGGLFPALLWVVGQAVSAAS